MSLKGPLEVLTFGTYSGPSGNSQGTNTKIYDLNIKLYFGSNSPCDTHLFMFLWEQQIFRCSKWRRPREPVAGRAENQMVVRSKDVPQMPVKNVS